MGRLIISARMTADAVMDPVDSWFEAGVEAQAYGLATDDGPAPLPLAFDMLRSADAMVLGRLTYEGLSTVWPTMEDSHGFADRVNAMPKYVASRTLTGPLRWNAELMEGDVPSRVAALKEHHTGNLISYGYGALASTLIQAGLVDELQLWVHPFIWGDGVRPLTTGKTPLAMRLIGSTTLASGVVLLTYQPLP